MLYGHTSSLSSGWSVDGCYHGWPSSQVKSAGHGSSSDSVDRHRFVSLSSSLRSEWLISTWSPRQELDFYTILTVFSVCCIRFGTWYNSSVQFDPDSRRVLTTLSSRSCSPRSAPGLHECGLISVTWLTGWCLFPLGPPTNSPVLLSLDDPPTPPHTHYTPYLCALLMRFIFLIMLPLTCRRGCMSLSVAWVSCDPDLCASCSYTHIRTHSSWSHVGQASLCFLTYKGGFLCSGSIDER